MDRWSQRRLQKLNTEQGFQEQRPTESWSDDFSYEANDEHTDLLNDRTISQDETRGSQNKEKQLLAKLGQDIASGRRSEESGNPPLPVAPDLSGTLPNVCDSRRPPSLNMTRSRPADIHSGFAPSTSEVHDSVYYSPRAFGDPYPQLDPYRGTKDDRRQMQITEAAWKMDTQPARMKLLSKDRERNTQLDGPGFGELESGNNAPRGSSVHEQIRQRKAHSKPPGHVPKPEWLKTRKFPAPSQAEDWVQYSEKSEAETGVLKDCTVRITLPILEKGFKPWSHFDGSSNSEDSKMKPRTSEYASNVSWPILYRVHCPLS